MMITGYDHYVNIPLATRLGGFGKPEKMLIYSTRTDGYNGEPVEGVDDDYVIHMAADELPSADAFWSFTVYDSENGFFMPNDHKKYSVGENGGMKLNDEGGTAIYVAADKPEGVPEENWLPLKRGDYGIDVSLCIYLPDLEKFKTWTQPKAERLSS